MNQTQRKKPLDPFALVKQQKLSSESSAIKSESSVDNTRAGVCPKCGVPMDIVKANTHSMSTVDAYMCAPCCVVTPIPA